MLHGATVSGGLTGAGECTFRLAQSHIWLVTSCWQMVGVLRSSLHGVPVSLLMYPLVTGPGFLQKQLIREKPKGSHSALLQAILVECHFYHTLLIKASHYNLAPLERREWSSIFWKEKCQRICVHNSKPPQSAFLHCRCFHCRPIYHHVLLRGHGTLLTGLFHVFTLSLFSISIPFLMQQPR